MSPHGAIPQDNRQSGRLDAPVGLPSAGPSADPQIKQCDP